MLQTFLSGGGGGGGLSINRIILNLILEHYVRNKQSKLNQLRIGYDKLVGFCGLSN
jgi:hypothetical protein